MAAKKGTEARAKRKRLSARDEYEAMVARKRDGVRLRREREAAEARAGRPHQAEVVPEARPDHDPNPPRQVAALRRLRIQEQARSSVVVVGPRTRGPGKRFKDQNELKKAVRAALGFGPGISFRADENANAYSKEAAQLLNRLRDVIGEVVTFVRSNDAGQRGQKRDDAADFLREWLDNLQGEDWEQVPLAPVGAELEYLVRYWVEILQPTPNSRQLAEMALRQGYWPIVDMKKHPTVADVIAQVSKAVRQSLRRRSGN